MFGDDPDPSVTTAWVGSGTVSGSEARGRWTEQRGLGMGLGGLCRRPWAERREEKCSPARFSETENVRCLTDYNVAIVIRWGIKRSPNAMKFERRSIYTIIRLHANFHPIPRTFSGHL